MLRFGYLTVFLTVSGLAAEEVPGWLRSEDSPVVAGSVRRLKQLTGRQGWPSEREGCLGSHNDGYGWVREDIGDPSVPQELRDGSIRVTGSGWGYLLWKSWKAFLDGEQPRWVHHDYALPSGELMNREEYPWDATVETMEEGGRKFEVLYGGSMTPRFWFRNNGHAYFSPNDAQSDARTRRVYPFIRNGDGIWVRGSESIFGPVNPNTWIGHNYGHQFIRDEDGQLWVFYERVNDDSINGMANRTEIYAAKMLDWQHADGNEVRVVTVGPVEGRAWPSTNRGVDQLSEGPRPIRVRMEGQTFYVVGYSSGSWLSAGYTMNFAAARRIDGDYEPQLTADGSDLEDVGQALKKRQGMTWGPGRPALFHDPDGKLWMLFHAKGPGTPCGFRNLYLAPAEVEKGADGLPKIRLSGLE